ncbi:AAA family ATPase [Lactococcus garvieae]|nr:AAA family ATPase [Lactococcus garvieae]CEF50987.1 hypothetical protein LGMT14_00848 [Lactococcus garvieae]
MKNKLEELLYFIDNINIKNYDLELENKLNDKFSILDEIDRKIYSTQYINLVGNIQPFLIYQNYSGWGEKNTWTENQIKQFENHVISTLDNTRNRLGILYQLEPLAKTINENIVLVGANGSGKSSYANYLSQRGLFNNLSLIPAQKILFAEGNNASNISTPETIQQAQSSISLKLENTYELRNLFSNLVAATVNQESQMNFNYKGCGEIPETEFDKFKRIFSDLFPEIDFTLNVAQREIIPIRNGIEYSLNAMSEGEKVAIYYILRILFSREHSYIIIDEPETFLNSNISAKLWNFLEELRSDCQFVYITHNIEFINSRIDSKIFWMKSSDIRNQSWIIEEVISSDIPQDLLISLLGSRKNILFCEGNGRSSHDYRVYETLFGENYTVYPVNGCENVKQYTRTYNGSTSNMFSNSAIGIIDYDLRSEEEINRLASENIFVNAAVNEIEMMLLLPEILDKVVKKYFFDSAEEKINNFKIELVKLVEENKSTIILDKTKRILEERLGTEKIQNNKTKEKLKEGFLSLFSETIFEDCYGVVEEEVEKIMSAPDYMSSLKINCLKRYKELTDKIFKDDQCSGINYANVAQIQLSLDKELSQTIKKNYYDMIPDVIN